MSRASPYLRGDAPEHSGRKREYPNLAPYRFTEKTMTRFKVLGAAAILSLTFATPVFAQAAIQEPGAFAFYYPNNDVLNGGRPTPAAGPGALTPEIFGSGGAAIEGYARGASCVRYRSYDPASGTFIGRDGRRHVCQ